MQPYQQLKSHRLFWCCFSVQWWSMLMNKSIGMTGTRFGMTREQKESFLAFLSSHDNVRLHHGDCLGADCDAHDIARNCGAYIIVHPPLSDEVRAFTKGDESHPPEGYLKRNRAIVNASEFLVAFPQKEKETARSGTWYTIRYAIHTEKPVNVVLPDGSLLTGEQIRERFLPGKWGDA